MKTIHYSCNQELSYPFPFPKEELIFFDIETTGLSPDTSALYLIGALYFKDKQWHAIQWFADNYQSEALLLDAFFHFLKDFSFLVHFNGTRFDIPYLEKKCNQHQLTAPLYSFSHLEQIDLYKQLSPYRKLFPMENLKQKSVESFLGIYREDTFSGKELIKIYQNYIKELQVSHSNDEKDLEHVLLLHNYEDLLGMLQSCQILFYKDLLEGTISFSSLEYKQLEQEIECKGLLPFSIASNHFYKDETISLKLEKNQCTLKIQLFKGELKYFYPNHKDYFYLPKEDTAIHKSVATYVDKEYRIKATKETCYLRKEGIFLPSFSLDISPLFRKEYASKENYLLLDENFFKKEEHLLQYMQSFFRSKSGK